MKTKIRSLEELKESALLLHWVGVHSDFPTLDNEVAHANYARLPITVGEFRDESWLMRRVYLYRCGYGAASRWRHVGIWSAEKGGTLIDARPMTLLNDETEQSGTISFGREH